MKMRKQSFVLVAVAGMALTACGDMMTGEAEMDPITRAVSGQTLTLGDSAINVMPNGALTGTVPGGELRGAWEVRNGQWCRTITMPERTAGTACHDVELGDNQITFLNPDGSPGDTWQIQ